MNARREQWVRLEERRQTEAQRRQKLEELAYATRQAPVAMELLTRDPNWDGFLQMIQQRREDASSKAGALRERLQSSAFLSLEELAQVRHDLALTQARIDALDEVIRIPSEVIRIGRA